MLVFPDGERRRFASRMDAATHLSTMPGVPSFKKIYDVVSRMSSDVDYVWNGIRACTPEQEDARVARINAEMAECESITF